MADVVDVRAGAGAVLSAGDSSWRRRIASSRGEAFDRIATLGAQLLDSPAAQITIMADRQMVAGHFGFVLDRHVEEPLVNSLCVVTAEARDVVAIEDATSDGRVSRMAPVVSGAIRSYLGAPLMVADEVVGAFCVFGPATHSWTARDHQAVRALAESATAELELAALLEELAASDTRLNLGFAAAGIGSFELDIRTRELHWDDRLARIFGLPSSTQAGALEPFLAAIHPDDLTRVTDAVEVSVATGRELAEEYRIVHPNGVIKYVVARGRTLRDSTGTAVRIVGAAIDTTELRAPDIRFGRVLESITDIFYAVDRDWVVTYVNSAMERRLNVSRRDILGRTIWEVFPHLVGTKFETEYRRAMESQRAASFSDFSTLLNGFYEVRAFPNPEGLIINLVDITSARQAEVDRRKAEQERELAAAQAMAANDRLRMLSEIGQVLISSLNADSTIKRVLDVLVPRIAESSVVHVLEQGRLRRAGVRADSPTVEQRLRAMLPKYMDPGDGMGFGVSYVASTGKGQFFDNFDPDQVEGFGMDFEQSTLWQELHPRSAVILPLIARGHTLGVFSVGRYHDDSFNADDLQFLEVVAARLALAIDNAQLFEFQRSSSETLQRALLTPPPESKGLQISVRYTPANAGAQVGGDWYDAFSRPGGATMLVIGDVMGHDVNAAGDMGQLRTMVRSAAFDRHEEAPDRILTRVDAMMRGLDVLTLATVVVAEVQEPRVDGSRVVRWSSAGHLPPVMVDAEGTAAVLHGGDLILGLDPTSARSTHEVVLPKGATLMLYTDGLVERRRRNTEDGIAHLSELLSNGCTSDLEDLLDDMLLVMGDTDDDTAVVAVRITD